MDLLKLKYIDSRVNILKEVEKDIDVSDIDTSQVLFNVDMETNELGLPVLKSVLLFVENADITWSVV